MTVHHYEIIRICNGPVNYRHKHVVAVTGQPDPDRRVVAPSKLAKEAHAWHDEIAAGDGVYRDPKDSRFPPVTVRTEAYRVHQDGRRVMMRWNCN